MTIHPPWSAEQIAALNAFQHDGRFHPFTCGNDSRHPVLVATPAGWICEACDYRQAWAHDFMSEQRP
jgi:hypothetical protein